MGDLLNRILMGPELEDTPSGGGGGNPSPDPAPAATTNYFTDDGKFSESAFDSLGEDKEFAQRHFAGKGLGEVTKLLKDNITMARTKAVHYPAADAPEEEWSVWREKAGVAQEASILIPDEERAKEYESTIGFNTDELGKLAEAWNKNGMPSVAFLPMLDEVKGIVEQKLTGLQAEEQSFNQEQEAILAEKFGPKLNDAITNADNAAKTVAEKAGFTPEEAQFLSEAVTGKNNQVLTRAFAVISDAIKEASYKGAAGQTHNAFVSDRQEAMNIMTDATHPEYEKYHSGDQAVFKKVQEALMK